MQQIIIDRNKYFPNSLYHSFNKPFLVDNASNFFYYTHNDKTPYIDLYNNVCHIGHSNPRILNIVKKGFSTINIHTRYLNEHLTNYTKHLNKYLFNDYKILFTNSGSESNDLAIQIALNYNKSKIGSFKRSYHGTTYLCNQVSHLTPTGQINTNKKLIDIDFYSPNDNPKIDSSIKAFILETYQGVGGNQEITNEWLKYIRENVDIMICDEVQTGFGRTGNHFWGFQKSNIIPDIITCGKSIANGYPMGACIFHKNLEKYLPNKYFNTFGGNSIACMVGKTVLEELEEKELQKNSKVLGEYLKNKLLNFKKYIINVTGCGLYLGIHFKPNINVNNLVEQLKNNYIIVGIGYNDILRIKPPLTITKKAINIFINKLEILLNNRCKL